MAAKLGLTPSLDKEGIVADFITVTVPAVGTVNGSIEGGVLLPFSGSVISSAQVPSLATGNGWELLNVIVSVGVNTTHTDGAITATVEKNTDGGTSALATAPVISDDAGTGFKTTAVAGTGITAAVVSATEANRRFADGDVAFVTITETGSGGTDPSDIFCALTFARLQDFNPNA